ncbi:MAG: CXXX repeat peptide modification system protein [Muribaculaceae bacterium]|nr:CXXX repeat peptide modification system protein [Muribaculaceae bacterium]
MKKEVGYVSAEERDEIQRLFERRNGLTELAKILTPDNDELYERLVADMGDTATRFQGWWNDKSAKYGWESAPEGHWEIDFNDCKIYLITN